MSDANKWRFSAWLLIFGALCFFAAALVYAMNAATPMPLRVAQTIGCAAAAMGFWLVAFQRFEKASRKEND